MNSETVEELGIYLIFYNRRTLTSHMFDDCLVVSDYGKFPAQFHVGRSRWWDLCRLF